MLAGGRDVVALLVGVMWKGSAESGGIKDVADVDGECGLSSSTKSMKAESEEEENADMARNDRRQTQSQRQSRSVSRSVVSGIGQTRRQSAAVVCSQLRNIIQKERVFTFYTKPVSNWPVNLD